MKTRVFNLFGKITEKLSYYMRGLCYGMSPSARIITVLTLFTSFVIINMYITYRGISSIFEGNSKENLMEIKHIESLEIPHNDTINNQLKQNFYEYE
jgi:hypothetical protein